jgi:G8 domain
MRCGLPRDEEPAETPVFIPTPVPQTITPSNPPRMSSRSPVDQGPAPTLPPVQPTPTINFGPIPLGPFITSSSERITIPDPPVPVEAVRQNCPHLDFDLLDWEDAGTWGGVVPTTGDVQLPDNSRVIIRQSVSGVLGVIKIPETSELVIGENPDGITLDVGGIDVQGKLTAGSETCRLTTTVTITLHGSRPNDAAINIRDGTYKGISVTGEISLHGKRFYRTWTRLAKSVLTGDTVLMLQHQVNWQPGQSIILVTTAMKDSREWHQNEVHIVIGVVVDPTPGVGAAVYLKRPVQHTHVANSGYQAEVGLLTRSIKIQGAAGDSEPIDPDPLNCRDSDRNMHGDQAKPCPNTELTGFGGHVIVYGNGMGYVEGVELFRMGQTNVLGRYPMHFHLLGDSCQHCYFRESSVHHSFYRCVSIHGTNYINVNENVAFDVTGYCYYLEDGVEHDNTISFNLAAHIHLLGPEAPWGDGQTTGLYQQSDILTLPADVTASGFYITNVQNNIIGNAASGGWSGFAFPNLPSPLGHHRDLNVRPSSALPLTIDGNTAHSTGWWWSHAGGFYFGGALYYTKAGLLEYNPGRDFDFNNHGRNTCNRDLCLTGSCGGNCEPKEQLWLRLTNTKAFLVPSVGLSSWSGRMEIVGFEAHDVGLSIEALAAGFWIDDMLAVCRTGSDLALPPGASASSIPGHGFFWYDDTDQEHIITSSTFRRCGYRSEEFIQYDGSPTRGCGDDDRTGCWAGSTVFGFLAHSDEFNPEIMQGTKKITFENCGRRFKLEISTGTPTRL